LKEKKKETAMEEEEEEGTLVQGRISKESLPKR